MPKTIKPIKCNFCGKKLRKEIQDNEKGRYKNLICYYQGKRVCNICFSKKNGWKISNKQKWGVIMT